MICQCITTFSQSFIHYSFSQSYCYKKKKRDIQTTHKQNDNTEKYYRKDGNRFRSAVY